MNTSFGKSLIVLGIAIIAVGILIIFKGRLPSWVGHLPGDVRIQRENFSFYFPFTTCLILSVLISLALRLFRK